MLVLPALYNSTQLSGNSLALSIKQSTFDCMISFICNCALEDSEQMMKDNKNALFAFIYYFNSNA